MGINDVMAITAVFLLVTIFIQPFCDVFDPELEEDVDDENSYH